MCHDIPISHTHEQSMHPLIICTYDQHTLLTHTLLVSSGTFEDDEEDGDEEEEGGEGEEGNSDED